MILDPVAIARYVNKANVVTAAWKSLFNTVPTKHAVVLAMGVAEFETHLGDAGGSWKGEHNWGAVHKRSLTAAEAMVLRAHGVQASTGEPAVAAARALLAPTAPDEALHIDDSPTGKYFVWFYAFPSDIEAAKKFLQTLVANRPPVRAVLDAGTPADVARAMYQTKYFTGIHKNDDEANIADYARNVAAKAQAIESALSMAGWDSGHAQAPLEDPSTVRVLTNLAEERASHSVVPLVVLGGIFLSGLALAFSMRTRTQTLDAALAHGEFE